MIKPTVSNRLPTVGLSQAKSQRILVNIGNTWSIPNSVDNITRLIQFIDLSTANSDYYQVHTTNIKVSQVASPFIRQKFENKLKLKDFGFIKTFINFPMIIMT